MPEEARKSIIRIRSAEYIGPYTGSAILADVQGANCVPRLIFGRGEGG